VNRDHLEDALSRYAPAGPPPGLRERIIGRALREERGRRRMFLVLAIAGALAVAGEALNVQGDRIYEDAARVAQSGVHQGERIAVARAEMLSVDMPGARALLAWNGDSHE